MGRTRLSDASSDTSKKKDKQASSSKSCQNDVDNSDSDSADKQPQVYPGTHWPLDATLELYINYDAVKEIRAVKSDFYPMLFYLTKCDYSSVARVVSKLPVIMDHLQARLDKGKGSTHTPTSKEAKPAPPTTTTSIPVRDIKTAKEEMLKLSSNMCLSQKDADDLLDWMKTFVTKKKGRTGYQLGEQDDIEDPPKPVTRTQAKTEDKLSLSKMQTNSDSKPISMNNKPVSTRSQAKTDSKSAATVTTKKTKKDSLPGTSCKARPPTREEIYANINKMTAAQILSQANNANSKKRSKSPKDKKETTGPKKRGRPRKNKPYHSNEESDSDSETKKVSTKRKSKSNLSKSFSPAASRSSPSPPILSSPTSSPLKFSLSEEAKQHTYDVIRDILNKKQSSEVDNRNVIAGDEWSQESPPPVRIPTPPFRNNFGPVPMCLYKVQADTNEPAVNDSLDLITPKIEIDIAEEEEEPYGRCVVKMEVENSGVSMLQSSSSVESSVTGSGLSQTSAPIIRTICTGPVCGGDNCVYEHSVIVQDCDNPDLDCVVESFVQEAKEAEPIIIIDDC